MTESERKQLAIKTRSAIERYIDEWRSKNSDKTDTEQLAALRSWSQLGNGVHVYISSSDLMPEFTLSDNAYASIKALGIEVNVNGRSLGDVELKLTDKGVYGLPDLAALIDYIGEHLSDEKLETTLSDFFIDNTVKVEHSTTSAKSIRDTARLETKAELLDQLLGKSEVSFRG